VDVDAVTLLFALLAVGAEAAVVVMLVLGAGARVARRVRRWWDQMLAVVGTEAPSLALVVASVATAGSLYLSEVAHFIPCKLCWYQRAAMYPLVPILAVGAWRRLRVWRLALPIAVVGGAISTYHVLIERFPQLETSACDPENPCSLIWIRRFGYLTIPTMALSAFALIAALMVVALAGHRSLGDDNAEAAREADAQPASP
jgi:disulfide bond formation protein DsbB